MIQAVLFFIDGEILKPSFDMAFTAKNISHFCETYTGRFSSKIVQSFQRTAVEDFCVYPRSVDPILKDGFPKKICNYLEEYHFVKHVARKALNFKEFSIKIAGITKRLTTTKPHNIGMIKPCMIAIRSHQSKFVITFR
ncbi:unnamed protein product [Caenorhabditis nigoni]|uniref:Uncharacterized protein n=1 Tax=Caenorhabditis nigoni TaxID=1611254 RepID=A0A2G5SF19_9PELO|nr:hypothetical protein B9Z55_027537 [Caenorhabditis nigoni]